MATFKHTESIVQQKLEAFERLLPEFEANFQFILDVHGQQRFPTLAVSDIVHYLHALWICECKDRLLSIYKNIERHEGRTCLNLLLHWQEDGQTADVIAFLQRKLDMLPLADITRQIHEAHTQHQDHGLAQRLLHGRTILLNRGMNMMQAFDAIISLSENDVVRAVREACEQYNHRPEQIAEQLVEMDSPLFAYVPHRALAQRNMVVMNKLSIDTITRRTDLPGQRLWRVVQSTGPLSPFAEQVVTDYQDMTSSLYNNLMASRFVDQSAGRETGAV